MATAEINSVVTRQAAKLHHGYTRQQLKALGDKHANRDLTDSYYIAAERREWVKQEIKNAKDPDLCKFGFKFYFKWKRSYRTWLKVTRLDLRVLPLP